MSGPDDLHDDDRLLDALRDALDDVPPIPPRLADHARRALAWSTIDGELARLVEDELAGVRGDSHLLTFEAGDAAVTVQRDDDIVVGSLVPAVAGTVEVVTDRAVIAVSTDDRGRFRAVASPPFRLVVRQADTVYTTEWITA